MRSNLLLHAAVSRAAWAVSNGHALQSTPTQGDQWWHILFPADAPTHLHAFASRLLHNTGEGVGFQCCIFPPPCLRGGVAVARRTTPTLLQARPALDCDFTHVPGGYYPPTQITSLNRQANFKNRKITSLHFLSPQITLHRKDFSTSQFSQNSNLDTID